MVTRCCSPDPVTSTRASRPERAAHTTGTLRRSRADPRCPAPPGMEPVPRGPWPLSCLLLLSLPAWSGAGAQDDRGFQLLQPQHQVWVTAGQTLNLTCTVSGSSPAGPVRWLKGWGSRNKTIYDQRGSFPRVTRVLNGSNTDFSILIRDAQPEDAGTYYCVKFRKSDEGDEVFWRGNGTEVSVRAKPTNLVVSGPGRRVGTGQPVSVTCTAGGFFPKDITVKWLKDGSQVSAQQPRVTPEQTKSSYTMSSTVTMTLGDNDVRSQLVCEVQHPTLTAPLRGTYELREALRVSPKVHVDVEPPRPVEVNKTVNFTCHAKGFYPGDVAVTWLENGTEMKAESVSRPKENFQGLFDLSSLLVVRATEEKNGSVFTCQVVHDAQDPVSGTAALWITAPSEKELGRQSQLDNSLSIYIVVGVVCTVLVVLVAAILYLIRAKQSKGKSSPSARLHEPEKSSEAAPQESDPNNLTYADLNFDKERKTIRRMVEMSQQSEYACIQTSQPPAGDDNLTYADLDMVHLSKAPRRPAPRPEEAGSEYASVQIPRK
ncbi:tyrosine-protein phosphatase non-receptor type substrate 1-like [Chlamydotis macqueenii]